MLENKYSSNEQARACLKTQIRARACSSIEKFYMIELLPGHLTKNALFLLKCVYFQRLYCIEYEKIEHRAGSSMLKNENSSIEHARSSKIGFGRAFFGLEHARVQHYYIALLYPCSTWASIYSVLYMNKLQMKYLTSCSMQKLRQ